MEFAHQPSWQLVEGATHECECWTWAAKWAWKASHRSEAYPPSSGAAQHGLKRIRGHCLTAALQQPLWAEHAEHSTTESERGGEGRGSGDKRTRSTVPYAFHAGFHGTRIKTRGPFCGLVVGFTGPQRTRHHTYTPCPGDQLQSRNMTDQIRHTPLRHSLFDSDSGTASCRPCRGCPTPVPHPHPHPGWCLSHAPAAEPGLPPKPALVHPAGVA